MKIKLLYGSQTGTAQFEAQTFCFDLIKLGFDVEIFSCDEYDFKNIIKENLIVIFISTTGQGEFPQNSRKFWENLLINFPENIFNNLKFALFGFGDSTYPKFNLPAKLIDFRLTKLGAQRFIQTVFGDDNHENSFFQNLRNWKLDFISTYLNKQRDQIQLNGWSNLYSIDNVELDQNWSFEEYLKQKDFVFGKVIKKERISSQDHFQEIYKLTIELPQSIEYIPGDVVSIHYTNNETFVNNLSKYFQDKKTIKINENEKFVQFLNSDLNNKIIELKNLFKFVFDIQSCPSYQILKKLSKYCEGVYKEKLEEMTYEDYVDYVIKPKRNISEILFDFKIKSFPLELILNNYKLIRPWEYSLASSYQNNQNKIQIIFNVVDYKIGTRNVKGFCTNYLKNLQIQDKIPIKISHGLFQYNQHDKPTIMIATGTGIAPFLSIIKEREKLGKLSSQKTVIIFGCRNKEKDFIEKDYLQFLEKEKLLKTFFAFSRDQKEKFYVQKYFEIESNFFEQFIQQNFEEIQIFVCGNSKFLMLSIDKQFKKSFKTNIGQYNK